MVQIPTSKITEVVLASRREAPNYACGYGRSDTDLDSFAAARKDYESRVVYSCWSKFTSARRGHERGIVMPVYDEMISVGVVSVLFLRGQARAKKLVNTIYIVY